jgi:hypothetical protein
MAITDDLPADYIPFERLEFCGNALINCRVPISVKGQPPLLVGKAPVGLWIWLWTPRNKDIKGWIALVEKNHPRNPRITVQSPDKDQLVVATRNDPPQPILAATRDNETQASVHTLDLRHIGLKASGDKNGLILGTTTLIGNTMENIAGAAFTIG